MKRLRLILVVALALMVIALPAAAQSDEPAAPADVVFDLAWVAAIIGFFLPLLISLVKRADWSLAAKRAVAFVSSVVAGLVNVGVQAGWEFNSDFYALAVFSIIDVYVSASVIYQNFWKDTAVDTSLTNVGSSAPV